MSYKAPLIVIRGSDICYLGIIRSCAVANIPVIGITFTWDTAPTWFSSYSQCQNETYNIHNPFTHPEQAAQDIQAVFQRLSEKWQQKLMVLPSSDTNYMFILDNYEQFSDYIMLMGDKDFASPRNDIMHKASCAELLMKGAPEVVPVTDRCASHDDIERIVDSMTYPAVYKPAVKDYGMTFYSSHNGNKAIECADADSLKAALKNEMDDGFDLVVQEKIFFESVYDEIPFYLYADAAGKINMAANGIKELIDPFPFGTAIILRFAWYPELLELAQKVVDALQYRGVLMIEFVKDQKDNQWKVIEVNPRHWLFNGFYQRLGINYTDALYQDLNRQPADFTCASERVLDKNYCHLDIQAIAKNWFQNPQDETLESHIEKLKEIPGTLTSAFFDTKDPEPGIQRFNHMVMDFGWDKKQISQLCELFER